ncbi:MAG: BCD family MFS transporter [Methylacidiphilales bacterium]|nr:BCD family MFS transporter [Candidatus Methylacidiphilales bacterium]
MSNETPSVQFWNKFTTDFMPFADAASKDLPLGRLFRLSLFQVTVGMATAMLVGTLNRVMIVELGMGAWLVATMIAIPLLVAPFRAFIGFKSDHHRSALGWKRVPYIWFGTLLQFGGFAFMPWALMIMSGDAVGPVWVGHVGGALAFLAVGAGMQTVQTAGLALATDVASEETRPRVVALMYVMLLVGMVAGAFGYGLLLQDFSIFRLIQVIQGLALVTLLLNFVALWRQEARSRDRAHIVEPPFGQVWGKFIKQNQAARFLVALGLGTAAFNMQDIVLEPYGAEILGLSVSATTALTALMAAGSLVAFGLSARLLGRGTDPCRLAANGALIGLAAFSAVIVAGPLELPLLFRIGVALIGFGGGLFAVGTLTYAMGLDAEHNGLALGAWGAVQATAAGGAIALGGTLRDVISEFASLGLLGPAMNSPLAGYEFVYLLEVLMLFAALVAIGPLVRPHGQHRSRRDSSFGLAEFPG